MQVLSMQSFNGRNIHSHKTVIKIVVDFGEYYKSPTKDIEGFNEKLLSMFPNLGNHFCSLGYEGGFRERLNEGTYIGHVTEHLIIELQNLMGYKVTYGKTRVLKEPSIYYIVFHFINELLGKECARAAIKIISAIAEGKSVYLESILNNLRRVAVETELGPSSRAIYDEAVRKGIPVTRIGNEGLLQLGYGKYSRRIEASLSDVPSCISVDIAGNKNLTKQVLKDFCIPVPHGDMAYTEDSAIQLAEEIGYPVVIKPYDANQGKGVTLDIYNKEQARKAFLDAVRFSKAVIVEKQIEGRDYRILVVGDKVSAVAERRPPSVVGDGIHNIMQLVEMENKNPLRGDDHEKPLTKIRLDDLAMQTLRKKGLDMEYTPPKNEVVRLRENGNLSTGGTARDCTDEIHPLNSILAVKAAKAIGLDIAGIDITTSDISVPISHNNGAVIEVNAAPGLRMHLYPTVGEKRNVAEDIVNMFFPQDKPVSVPIVSITGTNGKTTTTRLIRHTLALTGKKVGMTSTSGIFIGDECILKGDNTGPLSARMVLTNKEVEAAVLETARGGIVRKGLGYDLADIGIITNITDDHLGMDGVNTLEDLAFVKALVVEAIKPGGYAIFNADDAMTGYLSDRVKEKIMYFTRDKNNPTVMEHLKNRGRAACLEKNKIIIYDNGKRYELLKVEEIPITYGGMVECNIENSLAAASALFCLKIPPDLIKAGLMTFKPDIMSNPGRFNIFDLGAFKVMLDYGHNTAGYNAVIKFAQRIGAKRLIGIIGVPGDRMDKSIKEVGELCGNSFSKIYIKEDRDLRNRKSGEVASLLYDGVMTSGFRKENVKVLHSEIKALETAILDAQPDDLIIMLYEDFDEAVEVIGRFQNEIQQTILSEIVPESSVV